MDKAGAVFVLRALLQGADPETGKPLHRGEVVHRPEVMRALTLGLEALGGGTRPEKVRASAKPVKVERGKRPAMAGEGWDPQQDQELRALFQQRRPVPAIAAELGRTRGAITARLVKLGLVFVRKSVH